MLQCPYVFTKARLVVQEMTDLLVLDLVDKGLVTNQMVLTVGYDIDNLKKSSLRKNYHGEITTDRYGRKIPKHAHGTANLKSYTSSTKQIVEAVLKLYDNIVDPNLLVRRITVVANHVLPETDVKKETAFEQMDLFTDYDALAAKQEQEKKEQEKEKKVQQAMLDIKKKFGKNAILKGINLEEGATARDRNNQIGGHRA